MTRVEAGFFPRPYIINQTKSGKFKIVGLEGGPVYVQGREQAKQVALAGQRAYYKQLAKRRKQYEKEERKLYGKYWLLHGVYERKK